MNWTPAQKKILRDQALARVVYKNIWNKEHQLGYTTGKGNRFYSVVVAKDYPSADVRKIVLLHECGHIYYLHNEVDLTEEYEIIKGICEKNGKKISCLAIYGGLREFLNIAMDIEINEKALTKDNIETLKSRGIDLCTAENYNIPVMDNFRDYYEPLINLIDNKTAEELEQFKQSIQNMLDSMMQDLPNLKGSPSKGSGKGNSKGKNSNQKGENDSEDDSIGDEKSNKDGKSKGKKRADESKEGKESKDSKDGDGQKTQDKDAEEGTGKGNGDKELDDLLKQDENYGTQNVGEEDGDETTNVYNVMNEGSDGIGTSSGTGSTVSIGTTSKDEIKKFLTSIIKHDMKVTPDAFKIFNRKSRGETNLFYSSMKRKVRMDKLKMAIIIDISGSMNTSCVIQAVRSIKDIVNCLDSNSKLITWNTHKEEEFPLSKVPNQIRTGGGTAIEDGVEYAINNKFTDIVIYSDLETNIKKINELVNKHKVNLYTIRVGKPRNGYEGADMKEYYKNNKQIIEIEERN